MNTIRVLGTGIFTLLLYTICFSSPVDSTLLYSHIKPTIESYRQFPEVYTQNSIIYGDAYAGFNIESESQFEGYVNPNDSMQSTIQKANEVLAAIKESSNYIRNLNQKSRLEFPVGIKKKIGNIDYTLGIASIKLFPQWAELEVYMQLEIPQSEQKLTFYGTGIRFSNKGGILPGAGLQLAGDFSIPLSGKLGHLLLKGGKDGSRVSFGCQGFENMTLDAELVFARSLLLPDNGKGKPAEGNISLAFRTEVLHWNDILAEITLPAALVTSLPGFRIGSTRAIFDFSDFRNSPGFLNENTDPLWRGVYLQSVDLRLPDAFRDRLGQVPRLKIQGMILGSEGVSFKTEVSQLLALDDGQLGRWKYSIDKIKLHLDKNQLMQSELRGKIGLPISDEGNELAYKAKWSESGDFQLEVETRDDIGLSLWKGSRATLFENTSIELRVEDGEFHPVAHLYGEAILNIPWKRSEMALGKLSFRDLKLDGITGEMEVEYFQLDSESLPRLGNFPLSISKIDLIKSSSDQLSLTFDFGISLGKENSFSGASRIKVISQREERDGRERWVYSRTQVEEIELHAHYSAFKIDGKVHYEDAHETWGSFFTGEVQAEIEPGIRVAAQVVFGKTNEYKYWYLDAMAEMPAGIPLFGNMAVYGIGGGGSERMTVTESTSGTMMTAVSSGLQYAPHPSAGMSFKAILLLGSYPNKDTFTSELVLDMSFASDGSLRRIELSGNAKFAVPGASFGSGRLGQLTSNLSSALGKLDQTLQSSPAGMLFGESTGMTEAVVGENKNTAEDGVLAKARLVYDHENRIFHGNFEVFISLGKGKITGNGTNNRAGWATLHFAPDEWYIHIGHPDDRLGLTIDAGIAKIETHAYLVAGSIIPDLPPPPEKLTALLGGTPRSNDLSELSGGSGFLFGGSFDVDTGDQEFMMFYGKFNVGAGFDLFYRKTNSSPCGNFGGTNWRAGGQAYGYFDGLIGIKLDVFGKKQRIDILKISAAALIEASFPAPVSFTAQVGGYFEVLGGIVKGQCHFEVSLGDRCSSGQSQDFEGLEIISSTGPINNTTQFSVFGTPQIGFNMPINQVIKISENGVNKEFKAHLKTLQIAGTTGLIPFRSEWGENNQSVVCIPNALLPAHQEMTMQIDLELLEKKSGNWVPVINNGASYMEHQTIVFTTGAAPEVIPPENVVMSYPQVDQKYFHTQESPTGFLVLGQGQPELFQPDNQYTVQIGFQDDNQFWPASWQYEGNHLQFEIPPALPNDSDVKLIIKKVPIDTIQNTNQTVSQHSTEVETGEKQEVYFTETTINGNIEQLKTIELYSHSFHTSKFSTFQEKVESLQFRSAYPYLLMPGVHDIRYEYESTEPIDFTLLEEGQESVRIRIVPEWENDWFEKEVNPLVYQQPEWVRRYVSWRNPVYSGIIPSGTTQAANVGTTTLFTDKLPWYAYKDLGEIKSGLAGLFLTDPGNQAIKNVLFTNFPALKVPGNYGIHLEYYLPGKEQPNSMFILNAEIR